MALLCQRYYVRVDRIFFALFDVRLTLFFRIKLLRCKEGTKRQKDLNDQLTWATYSCSKPVSLLLLKITIMSVYTDEKSFVSSISVKSIEATTLELILISNSAPVATLSYYAILFSVIRTYYNFVYTPAVAVWNFRNLTVV